MIVISTIQTFHISVYNCSLIIIMKPNDKSTFRTTDIILHAANRIFKFFLCILKTYLHTTLQIPRVDY